MTQQAFNNLPVEVQRLLRSSFKTGWVTALAELSKLLADDDRVGIEPSGPRLISHMRQLMDHPVIPEEMK